MKNVIQIKNSLIHYIIIVGLITLWLVPKPMFSIPENIDGKRTAYTNIVLPDLLQMRHSGMLHILDIRSQEQFAHAHIPDSENFQMDESGVIPDGKLQEWANKTMLVVICSDSICPISAAFASRLAGMGLSNVHVYRGGFAEWKSCGLPIKHGKGLR